MSSPSHESLFPQTPFEITPIPFDPEIQVKRGWDVLINGERIESAIGTVEFVNSRMGMRIAYGQRPEGYDGPIIEEPGGGGSVTIPYMINPKDGGVYVGVVEEDRPAAGGIVSNVPRGFLEPNEDHTTGAVRELAEETGLHVLAERLIPLAEGINMNSALSNTSGQMDDGSPRGARIYGLPLSVGELEKIEAEDGNVEYVFPLSIREKAENKIEERIVGSRFIRLERITKESSPDGFTLAASGALWSHLMGTGALKLADVEMEPVGIVS